MKNTVQKVLAIILVAMLLSADIAAIAEAVITLPDSLKIIEAEAFMGDTSIEKVIVPEGAEEIHDRAFAESSIKEIELPESLEYIADDAFEGSGSITVTAPENTYAYDRCVELGLIEADTMNIPESAHPYEDEFDYTWTYNAGDDVECITITFSTNTETEDGYDFIYIYTINDVQLGKYSGTELAGQSITIEDTGFKLRLTSDEAWDGSNAYFGFKIDSIVPKKSTPLTFIAITTENKIVNAGDVIRWTVATAGGKAPVYYDYTVLLNDEEVEYGTVEAPNAIEYTPVRAGEYKLSVIVRDSADAVLSEHISEAVTVSTSTAYPESAHPYTANMDQSWVYAAEENVESLIVTFSEETDTQSNKDYIYIYDQSGTEVGKYSGTELAGQTLEIMGTAFTIRLTANASTQHYGFTITNIEKYIPGPLSYVSLTADKSKAKTGELITWTMETEGGRRPITYEYEIILNNEIIYSSSVIRPEQISYVPMEAGDYTMSIMAKDAEGNELPTQISRVRITEREKTAAEYFTYEAINGLYARITGYTGTDTGVIVPETIDDYTVQEIGEKAFQDNATLVSIVLPDTVTTISASAFRNCDALRGVDLGQGVTSVGEYAFYDCDSLVSFTFPDSVTKTGQQVLRYCDNLSSVDFPVGWEIAGRYTVADNPKLTTIILPEGLKTVPSGSFSYCSNIKYIEFPSTLESIKSFAFYNCHNIEILNLNTGLIEIEKLAFSSCTNLKNIKFNECLTQIDEDAFAACTSLITLDIPSSVTTLGGFRNCKNLISVNLKEGLQKIIANAFSGCESLETIVLPNSLETIGSYAFANCTKLNQINFPACWNKGANQIFSGCTNLRKFVIPEGITSIPPYAFAGATYINEFILPTTLQTIGDYAFNNCEGIQNIDFPDNLTQIGISAFEGCANLKKALLPDGVTTIGIRAFVNCGNLEEFDFPVSWINVPVDDSVYIGTESNTIFTGCNKLNKIEIPEGATIIPNHAFRYLHGLSEIILPESLTSIGIYAFQGCTSISSIALPDGIESIGESAFESCTNLANVNIPNSLQSIGTFVFKNCKNLTQIDLPNSLTVVGYGAFMSSGLKSLILPDGLETIADYSFENCDSLESVTIPGSVTSMKSDIFRGCVSLSKVHLSNGLKKIASGMFRDCCSIEEIVIPKGVTSIGDTSFLGCSNLKHINIPDSVNVIGNSAFSGDSLLSEVVLSSTLEEIGSYAFANCVSLESISMPDSLEKLGRYAFTGCVNLREFGYPINLKEITVGRNQGTTSSGHVFEGCTNLKEVIVPDGVKTCYHRLFDYAESLTKLVLPESLELIYLGKEFLQGSPNVTIYCEYGTYALKYAIANEIPYFYLSLSDASKPSGSLYKGDSFELTGYVRSSEPISSITGYIIASDGETIVQTVTVEPQTTDFNLGGYFNTSLKFGTLALGNYYYELHANTATESEVLCRTSFTIIPPPLRAYLSNINVPSGYVSLGTEQSLSGTIRTNYTMTNFVAVVQNAKGDNICRYVASPNALTVDLADASSSISIATLDAGSYTFSVYVSANGTTRNVLKSDFYLGRYDANVPEEDMNSILSFVQSSKNRSLFDKADTFSEEAIQSMDASDVALMTLNTSTNMVSGYVRGLLKGKLTNMHVVDLYKKDITDAIAAAGDVQLIVDTDKQAKQKEKIVQWIIKEGNKDIKELKDTGIFSDNEMDFLTILFKGLKIGSETYTLTLDLAESIYTVYSTYENGYLVIDTVAASFAASGDAEFTEAVAQLHQEYRSAAAKDISEWYDAAFYELQNSAEKELAKILVKKITSGVSGVSIALKAVEMGMKLTGADDIAEANLQFLTRYNTYLSANDAYKAAFDAVTGGDSSSEAICKLSAMHAYVKQCTLNLCDSIIGLDTTDDNNEQRIQEYRNSIESLYIDTK